MEYYSAEGSKVWLTQCTGLPKKSSIPQFNSITDTIFDSSIGAAAKNCYKVSERWLAGLKLS